MLSQLQDLLQFVREAVTVVEGVAEKVQSAVAWVKEVLAKIAPIPFGESPEASKTFEDLMDYFKEQESGPAQAGPVPFWVVSLVLELISKALEKLKK